MLLSAPLPDALTTRRARTTWRSAESRSRATTPPRRAASAVTASWGLPRASATRALRAWASADLGRARSQPRERRRVGRKASRELFAGADVPQVRLEHVAQHRDQPAGPGIGRALIEELDPCAQVVAVVEQLGDPEALRAAGDDVGASVLESLDTDDLGDGADVVHVGTATPGPPVADRDDGEVSGAGQAVGEQFA